MSREPALILAPDLRIPAGVHALPAFRRWCLSEELPERGRIDFQTGDVHVDLGPEDLYTHGAVKTAIAAELHGLIAKADRGTVFVDRARVTAPAAGLSVAPDVVVVLWESLEAGRVPEVAGAGPSRPGRFVELEGAPDLVVEILSDRSVRKDRDHLPRLYAQAGVPELWLVDARGDEVRFEVSTLRGGSYAPQPADAAGWAPSPLLRAQVRLTRRAVHGPRFRYDLETAPT